MKFRGENCVGGKLSKERLTILLAANLTGSEKMKPVVIGKSTNPRCFKNIKSLPVQYESNRKAWMTSDLFEKTIRLWDTKIYKEKKKILLLVDNCPAHPVIENLKAIKLVFLPANTTSVLQPLDQGIIKSFKTHYRKLQVAKIIEHIDSTGSTPKKLDVLEAILLTDKAWERVSQTTISNCFRHGGFHQRAPDFSEEDDLPLTEWVRLQSNQTEPEDQPFAEWIRFLDIQNLTTEENWENFDSVDESLVTETELTEEDILGNNEEEMITEKDDDEEFVEVELPTLENAFKAVQTIGKYAAFNNEDIDQNIRCAISDIERFFEKKYLLSKHLSCKQSKITEFFAKI